MGSVLVAALAGTALVACAEEEAGGGNGEGPVRARAVVRGAPGSDISGEVTLVEIAAGRDRPTPGVRVVARIDGLPRNSRHGFHIHEKGACEPPFTSAGGHFDPGPFGNSSPDENHPFHMGDLPNLRVGKGGTGRLTHVTNRVTLSPGPLSLFDGDGSAVIVHQNEDKGVPGQQGASGGPRLACGVIRLQRGGS